MQSRYSTASSKVVLPYLVVEKLLVVEQRLRTVKHNAKVANASVMARRIQ